VELLCHLLQWYVGVIREIFWLSLAFCMWTHADAQSTSSSEYGTDYTVARESQTDGIDVFTDVSTAAVKCRMLMTAVSSIGLLIRRILASVKQAPRNLRVS
jgi:hypothetical protein